MNNLVDIVAIICLTGWIPLGTLLIGINCIVKEYMDRKIEFQRMKNQNKEEDDR